MSDNREELRPYEEALASAVSDVMAGASIPQVFWPAQVLRTKRAIEPPAVEGRTDG